MLTREVGTARQLVAALQNLALWHYTDGDLDAAEPLFVQSLALAREQGNRSGTADALCSLAALSIERGSHEPARAMLFEATEIAGEIGSKRAGRQVLDGSAALAACLGDWDRASRFYGAAQTQLEQTGIHRDSGDEAFLMPWLAKSREALGEAAFAVSEANGRVLSYEDAISEVREWLENRS